MCGKDIQHIYHHCALTSLTALGNWAIYTSFWKKSNCAGWDTAQNSLVLVTLSPCLSYPRPKCGAVALSLLEIAKVPLKTS